MAIGYAVGPVAGGALAQNASWRVSRDFPQFALSTTELSSGVSG